MALNPARGKARDVQRLANKKQVITALNLYYNTNNAWPASTLNDYNCFGASSSETCWNGGQSGLDSLITAMTPYMSSFPNNNADSGTHAYNRMLYASFVPAGNFAPGSPAGAYLIWIQEKSLANCGSDITAHLDKYYYCYEYLGP